MIYKFFDKKSSGSGANTSLANKFATEQNYQLENKLHRDIIKKFKRRRVYLFYRGGIQGVDLADIQPLSK